MNNSKKATIVLSAKKLNAFFWDAEMSIYYLRNDQDTFEEYYVRLLGQLRKAIRNICPGKLTKVTMLQYTSGGQFNGCYA